MGKVKELKCVCCGASLQGVEADSVNVKCEYCGQMVRVYADDDSFSTEAILEKISQLGNRVRNDGFDTEYERAKYLIRNHNYNEASVLLNTILANDITQARAWYYKSLLPVLDQGSVKFRGSIVDIQTVAKLVKRNEINEYLEQCGIGLFARRAFMNYYATGGFLYEQQKRFLNDAIQYASTPKRREFFKQKRQDINSNWQNRVMRRNLIRFFFITAFIVCGALIVYVGVQAGETILRILART